ncbi:CHAT domain-containing protein [Azohydromonas australica]|uniref:CHAT domain-containing protein n=1 Tax=Azohydromonas australica TaxID=364039 RepID=UPI00041105E2|nr:CHAT domain-containing protein [Azohydromonas australica]
MGLFDAFRGMFGSRADPGSTDAARGPDRCPQCNAETHGEIVDYVDAGHDPQCYAGLRAGTLNRITCSNGHEWTAIVPLLVHLPQRRKVVFFAPSDLSEDEQNGAADRLMERLRKSVGHLQPYMTNLAMLETDRSAGYGGLLHFLDKLDPIKNVPAAIGHKRAGPKPQLLALLQAAMKEENQHRALDLWQQLLDATNGTGDDSLHATACQGIGVSVLKLVTQTSLPENEHAQSLEVAISALGTAARIYKAVGDIGTWAAVQLNLATAHVLAAADSWQGFIKASALYLSVLEDGLSDAPAEWRRAHDWLLHHSLQYFQEQCDQQLDADRCNALEHIATRVLWQVGDDGAAEMQVPWLELRGQVALSAPQADWEQAASDFLQVIELSDRDSDPKTWARANQNLTAALGRSDSASVGVARRAVQALQQCLEIYTEPLHPARHIENSQNLARALSRLALLLADERFEVADGGFETLATLQRACVLFEKHGPTLEFVQALCRLAQLYENAEGDAAENNELALHTYLMAQSHVDRESDPALWAQLEANIGLRFASRMHAQTGRFEYGDVQREAPDINWVSFGSGLLEAHHQSEAIKRLENALKYFQAANLTAECAKVMADLATVRLEAARMPLGGNADNAAARASQENAIAELERAIEMFDGLGDALKGRRVRAWLACAYTERVEGDRTCNLLRSMEIYRTIEQQGESISPSELQAHTDALLAAHAAGVAIEPDRVTRLRERLAVPIQAARGTETLKRLRRLAQLDELAGDRVSSQRHRAAALDAFEALIREALTLESANFLHQEHSPIYSQAFADALDAGDTRQAFILGERFRFSLPATELRTLALLPQEGLDQGLLAREADIMARIRADSAGIVRTTNTIARANLVSATSRHWRDVHECWSEMERSGPSFEAYLDFRRAKPAEWEEVQAWLDRQQESSAVALFVTLDEKLVLLVAKSGHEAIVLHEWPLGQRELWAAREQFAQDLSTQAALSFSIEWLPQLSAVADALAAAVGNASVLYLMPDGALAGLPLHALEAHGRPLIERTSIIYIRCLWPIIRREALANGAHSGTARPEVLAYVFGNPTEDLPEAASEAHAIATQWDVSPMLGAAVTRGAVLQALRSGGLVHISGHATFGKFAVFNSGLELAGGERLTAGDLFAESARCKVLVLSACDAALQHCTRNGELLGFPSAATAAGIETLVAARWPVDDEAARVFMLEFHRALCERRGVRPADVAIALRQAASRLRDAGWDRLDWAPFVVHA